MSWSRAITKQIPWVVVIAILIGGVLAVRSGSERSRLRAEHRRLSEAVGELTIEDPTKVSLVALDTGDPMHFAWRVYLPANYRVQLRYDGGSSSSWRSDPAEFIARVRFREGDRGQLQVYTDFHGGSGLSSRGDASVCKLVCDHWDRLEIEQLGSDGAVSIDVEETAALLRIRLPADLREQAMASLPVRLHSVVVPEFYGFVLGPSDRSP